MASTRRGKVGSYETPSLLAEFESADAFVAATRELRSQGYTELNGFMPFLPHGALEAAGFPRSRLPAMVLGAALLGAGGAYLLQWYTVAYDYVLNVGGRPPHSPVFVPITFEMGILAAAFCALLGALALARLPALWHPVFDAPGFERASIDRFWLGVAETDPKFDEAELRKRLQSLGALQITRVPVAAAEGA